MQQLFSVEWCKRIITFDELEGTGGTSCRLFQGRPTILAFTWSNWENFKKALAGKVSWPRFKLGTYLIQVKSITTWANLLVIYKKRRNGCLRFTNAVLRDIYQTGIEEYMYWCWMASSMDPVILVRLIFKGVPGMKKGSRPTELSKNVKIEIHRTIILLVVFSLRFILMLSSHLFLGHTSGLPLQVFW
jgi:hypothetical protein